MNKSELRYPNLEFREEDSLEVFFLCRMMAHEWLDSECVAARVLRDTIMNHSNSTLQEHRFQRERPLRSKLFFLSTRTSVTVPVSGRCQTRRAAPQMVDGDLSDIVERI